MKINKSKNVFEGELSKLEAKKLANAGYVSGYGDGRMKSTKLLDGQTLLGTSETLLKYGSLYFTAQYISGCFYPIFRKVYTIGGQKTKFTSMYLLGKDGKVRSVKADI